MCTYRFGIEEEYYLTNRRSGRLCCELPDGFMHTARRFLGERVTNEMLQSQIEVATHPCTSGVEAGDALLRFRATLAEVGRQHGIGIVAAGTHPLAYPHEQRVTPKARYRKIVDDLGFVGLGNPRAGLHVHVEVPDADRRIGIMHRLVPFLPLLLALSTSSPFWAGQDTGLLGYRLATNDALPRSGYPEQFKGKAEYDAYVRALVAAKIIPDASYVWWLLRPSMQHPTLELRITDCCTSIADAVAIASLFRALVRHFVRHPSAGDEPTAMSRAFAEENRWTAQRYGTGGTYIDGASGAPMRFDELLESTIALVADDLAELGHEREVQHLRNIAERGTSAHLQLQLYRAVRETGKPSSAALRAVAKWLQASSEAGDFVPQTGAAAVERRREPLRQHRMERSRRKSDRHLVPKAH